ncbi:MAG: hypothetical protein J6Q14_01290 [Oscillospiraceae bacterium]|nr:hypothetical protein [Oscillospiraceae bacterium]
MSVIGGVALFALGVAAGGGVLGYTQWAVRTQTAQLRRENEHLKESAWRDKLDYETHKAYNQGYRDGRLSPASEAEKFAEFVEDHNIDFRGQRRKRRVYGEAAEGTEPQ